jgi:cation transport protein ChaC
MTNTPLSTGADDSYGDVRPMAPKGPLISRDSLMDGSFTTRARVMAAGVDMFARSDEEIESTRVEFLAQRPQRNDLWVFGYGSLMWNLAINYAERRGATLKGWHRRFCI